MAGLSSVQLQATEATVELKKVNEAIRLIEGRAHERHQTQMSELDKALGKFEESFRVQADRTLAQRWEMRASMIAADPLTQKTMTAFPTYPDSDDQDVKDFCAAVNSQLTIFRGRKGIFARSWIFASARDMPAHLWWDQNGGSVPELQAPHANSNPSPPPLTC